MMSGPRLRTLVGAIAVLALLLGACGEDDSLGQRIEVTDELLMPSFVLTEFDIEGDLVVPEGALIASVVNGGFVEHNVGLEDGLLSDTLWTFGETTTLDLGTLAPGEYVLYCDTDGHRTSGMEATLTVLPVIDGVMTIADAE